MEQSILGISLAAVLGAAAAAGAAATSGASVPVCCRRRFHWGKGCRWGASGVPHGLHGITNCVNLWCKASARNGFWNQDLIWVVHALLFPVGHALPWNGLRRSVSCVTNFFQALPMKKKYHDSAGKWNAFLIMPWTGALSQDGQVDRFDHVLVSGCTYIYIYIYIYINYIYIIYTYSTRRFKKWGYPQIIHLKWIIHCKPSSYWGNPMESPISVGSVEVTPGLSATASAARSAASSWLAKSMATAISSYHVIF